MASDGLAFGEEKDMKKLSKMEEKGWVLQSFAPLGYKLRKSNPRHLIYSLDYQHVPKEELEDYYDIFKAGGWQPVCSESGMHIFSAAPGTKPIYTDRSTVVEEYKRAKRVTAQVALFLFVLTTLAFAADSFIFQDSSAITANVFYWLRVGLLALLAPAAATWIAYQVRVSKLMSKLKRE
ncbi:DUF2812 domain-containing protein [Bacillus aerolatus]|uniref:DUF2812 domain-containing protein n=2 Tax=Bacillus aerolatus TaxID=2653354 RepID=A0A6I1FKX1_9BACI|nr:DUF2812 domain-containing protein [Bacillus aerolatus]